MAIVNTCKKCSLSIDNKVHRFVVCEGECARFFHCDCARLSEKEVTLLSTNYIWLCDECLREFQRARDEKASRDDNRAESSHVMETPKRIKR